MQPIYLHWSARDTLALAHVGRRRAHCDTRDPPAGVHLAEGRVDGGMTDWESLWTDLGGEG
jgi:hypothetical protein